MLWVLGNLALVSDIKPLLCGGGWFETADIWSEAYIRLR